MLNATTLPIGIAAGLASALLLAAVQTGNLVLAPVFLLAPLPLILVGLAYSAAVASVAVLTMVGVWMLVADFTSGLTVLFLTAGPALLMVYLLGLSRQNAAGSTEWYPIDRALLFATGAVAAGVIAIGLLFGFDPEAIAAEAISSISANSAAGSFSQEQIDSLTHLYVVALPYLTAAGTLAVVVGNSWLGARILEAAGRLRRPRPPAWAVQLPRQAAYALIAAILVAFLPGTIGTAGAVVAGAFGFAFALIGLAVIHAATLGRDGRALILVLVYAAILFFGVPLVLIALLGLADSFRLLRPRPPALSS